MPKGKKRKVNGTASGSEDSNDGVGEFNKRGFFSISLYRAMLCSSVYQGPVVQSIISLTSSLRGQLVKCFTTL